MIAEPQPGKFKLRKVRGGPYVAAEITRPFGMWSASIDGVPCGATHADPVLADGVFRIWTIGIRIEDKEFRALLGPRAVDVDQPVNLGGMPPVF